MGRSKRKVKQRAKSHQKLVNKGRRQRIRARRKVRFGARVRRKAAKRAA